MKNKTALYAYYTTAVGEETYTKSASIGLDKGLPSFGASGAITIKKGAKLVKMCNMPWDGDGDKDVCIGCMAEKPVYKNALKSLVLNMKGRGHIINSKYNLVMATAGDM